MSDLKVYTFIPRRASASYYYRMSVPMRSAQDLGLPMTCTIDTDDPSITPESRYEAMTESDVVVMYQPVGPVPMQTLRALNSLLPAKREGGWKHSPSFVVETDDNLFQVSPLNPAFKGLGVRSPEGEEIPEGHQVGVMQNGERKILYQDGKSGFSIARNREVIRSYKWMLENADAVSCSTPNLVEEMKSECNQSDIRCFPNLVRMNDYEQIDLKEDPNTVKILWQGGAAHYDDWWQLRGALGRITKKYPQVQWVIWGQMFHWATELIPADRYSFNGWCAYEEYKLRRVMIGEDISLAPLTNNPFNRCRSAIKFYEAAVSKKPAATLAQRTGAYEQEIQEGKTGLLFSDEAEFEHKLSGMIEDSASRKEMAQNAKDWVRDNRDAHKGCVKLYEFWQELRANRDKVTPHMPDSQWIEFEKEQQGELVEA